MKVIVEEEDISRLRSEIIALGIFKDVKSLRSSAQILDKELNGTLSALLNDGDFEGKRNEIVMLQTRAIVSTKRVLLVGLGEEDKFNLDVIREVSARACIAAKRFDELVTTVYGTGISRLKLEEATQALVEGASLGGYTFDKYKTSSNEERIKLNQLRILAPKGSSDEVTRGASRGEVIAEGVCLAREIANEPGGNMTPTKLSEKAREICEHLGLSFKVLTDEEMKKEGMGGLLGVGKGSSEPPKFIIIEHNADKKDLDTIVLIGKGITFDSGGISIKPAKKMDEMKYDKSGAAAVIGIMQTTARLNLPLHVVGLIPAAENLPSGSALKPGDIIRISNGKTVEIKTTDAEGRLILADALSYARQYDPKAVLDLATLFEEYSLGKYASALFGNNYDLIKRLTEAAEKTGERLWPLPLYDEHTKQIESKVADIKNDGEEWKGGASTAAAFLKEFTNYNWAHMDIGGTAWDVNGKKYNPEKGATGVGVRLIMQFLRDWVSGG